MHFNYRDRATVYLKPDLHGRIKTEANRLGLSISSYLSMIVTAHLDNTRTDDTDNRLHYLTISVNALLKYHPSNNLLPLVQTTWKNRQKRLDDIGEHLDV